MNDDSTTDRDIPLANIMLDLERQILACVRRFRIEFIRDGYRIDGELMELIDLDAQLESLEGKTYPSNHPTMSPKESRDL